MVERHAVLMILVCLVVLLLLCVCVCIRQPLLIERHQDVVIATELPSSGWKNGQPSQPNQPNKRGLFSLFAYQQCNFSLAARHSLAGRVQRLTDEFLPPPRSAPTSLKGGFAMTSKRPGWQTPAICFVDSVAVPLRLFPPRHYAAHLVRSYSYYCCC